MNHPIDELFADVRESAIAYYEKLEAHKEKLDMRDFTREEVRHHLTEMVASLAYLGHLKGKSPLLLRNNGCPRLP